MHPAHGRVEVRLAGEDADLQVPQELTDRQHPLPDVHPARRLFEDGAQHALDLLELLGPRDERRGELDDRVAAVVGAADQAALEQLGREEAAQQRLGLLVVEGLAWSPGP